MGADYTARFARRPAPDRVQRRRILPRSRHRPVAVTEGSRTRNLNKTGVRLWSDCPLDEHREVRRGDALDAIADRANRGARSDQRGRTVGAPPRCRAQTSCHAFDLEDHCRDMRRALEHLTGPSIETAASLEDRLDPASMKSTTNSHVEAHHVRPWRLGLVAQRDGPGATERADLLTLSDRRVRRGRRDRSLRLVVDPPRSRLKPDATGAPPVTRNSDR